MSALAEKRQQIRMLEEENANLLRDIEAKKQRIERLKNDPKTQEVEIEKRLGRIHSGDTQFKISGQPPSSFSGSNSSDSTKGWQ